MARPKKSIDPDQVEKLAAAGCTYAEIAAELGCSEKTLQRRFVHPIKKGQNRTKLHLRRKQCELAMNGNVPMLIWLGKQLLGQKDKIEQSSDSDHPLTIRVEYVHLDPPTP